MKEREIVGKIVDLLRVNDITIDTPIDFLRFMRNHAGDANSLLYTGRFLNGQAPEQISGTMARMIERLILSGHTITKQDDEWCVFREDGEGVANGPTLYHVLNHLHFKDSRHENIS